MLPNGKEVTINNLGAKKASGWSNEFILNQPTKPGAPIGMTGYTKVQTVSKQVAVGDHTLEFHVEDISVRAHDRRMNV